MTKIDFFFRVSLKLISIDFDWLISSKIIDQSNQFRSRRPWSVVKSGHLADRDPFVKWRDARAFILPRARGRIRAKHLVDSLGQVMATISSSMPTYILRGGGWITSISAWTPIHAPLNMHARPGEENSVRENAHCVARGSRYRDKSQGGRFRFSITGRAEFRVTPVRWERRVTTTRVRNRRSKYARLQHAIVESSKSIAFCVFV